MRHGDVSYRRAHGTTVFSKEVMLTEAGVPQARLMHQRLAQTPLDLAVPYR